MLLKVSTIISHPLPALFAHCVLPSLLNPIEKPVGFKNKCLFQNDFMEVWNSTPSYKSKKSPLNEFPPFGFKCIVEIISPNLASPLNELVSNTVFPCLS